MFKIFLSIFLLVNSSNFVYYLSDFCFLLKIRFKILILHNNGSFVDKLLNCYKNIIIYVFIVLFFQLKNIAYKVN